MSKVLLGMQVNFFSLLGAKISVLQHNFFSSDVIRNLFTRDYLTKFHVVCSQIMLQRWGNEFISKFFPVSLPEGQHCFSFSQGLIFLTCTSDIQNSQALQTKTWNQITTSHANTSSGNTPLKEKMSGLKKLIFTSSHLGKILAAGTE